MKNRNKPDLWVREIHKDVAGLSFKVEKTLFSGQSRYQHIDIVQTAGHGRMLLNDGIVMLAERDEFIYHEMIAHVPLFVHPAPEQILVIGGGDGGTVREVLRHPGVQRVVMVEIDELVVNACRDHIPSVSCAMDDPRMELLIADGVGFIAETDERFDVIIIDSTDPVGPAQPLFDKDFYKNAAARLAPDGILIAQAESPFYDLDLQLPMLRNLRPFFPKLHLYLFTCLTYPGGLWSFAFASNGLCPIADFDPEKVRRCGFSPRYYNPAVHRSAFALPTFAADNLAEVLDPVEAPHTG